MDINLLVNLTSRAWSLHILALLESGVPGRQAPLLAASGAGRTAFAGSLEHLIDLNLLERNPGHGHPLRPEYRLTPQGIVAAKMAGRIMGAAPGLVTTDLLRRSWTVPILAIADTPRHFSEIRSALGPVTDRALSLSLRQLHDRRWLRRDVDAAQRPLRPTYLAINDGARISSALRITA